MATLPPVALACDHVSITNGFSRVEDAAEMEPVWMVEALSCHGAIRAVFLFDWFCTPGCLSAIGRLFGSGGTGAAACLFCIVDRTIVGGDGGGCRNRCFVISCRLCAIAVASSEVRSSISAISVCGCPCNGGCFPNNGCFIGGGGSGSPVPTITIGDSPLVAP